MILNPFIFLSVGTLLVLSGCYEKGNFLTPSSKHIKKKKEKPVNYDFPVLKLSANTHTPKVQPKDTTKLARNIREVTIKKPVQKRTEKSDTLTLSPTLAKVERKKKLTTARRSRKRFTAGQIPILGSISSMVSGVSLMKIPIVNKIIPEPSQTSKSRIKKMRSRPSRSKNPNRNRNRNTIATIPVLDHTEKPTLMNRNSTDGNAIPLNFSGGTSASHLDIAKIRIETDNYQTNIVLDSYLWVKYNNIPSEASAVSGTYFFKYEPFNDRIVGHVKGYKSFSALLTRQDEMLKTNPMIKNIYIDRYVGDDGIKFIIELKKKVKMNVIDVEDPGSIIVELYPLK